MENRKGTPAVPAESPITLSIIIVAWNCRAFVLKCISSLSVVRKTLSPQIIIVDNASDDGTADALRNEFPDITLVINETNEGFVAANNRALPLATGELVLFLNPDTEVTQGAIETLVGYLGEHPEAAVVGPQLLYADGSIQSSSFSFPTFFSIGIRYVLSAKLATHLERPRKIQEQPRRADVVRGAALMIRRSIAERVGGMNRRLFMYAEETDLCFKVQSLGYDVVLCPAARIIHLEQRSIIQRASSFTAYQDVRSTMIFLEDNYPPARARTLRRLVRWGLRVRQCVYALISPERSRLFAGIVEGLRGEGLW